MASLTALINEKSPPNLSRLSPEDACKVLKARATVLDVKTLASEWQDRIASMEVGIVQGLHVPGKFGLEEVIVCQSTWTGYDPNRDAFTMSEYDWLMVEVNLLWRRAYTTSHATGKARAKIPFVCRYCNADMVDKANLGFHRQMDMCPVYDPSVGGPLKIYPSRGQDGNKESRAVFRKYNLQVPWQMLGKHMKHNSVVGIGRQGRVVLDSGSGEEGDTASREEDDDAGQDVGDDFIDLSSPDVSRSRRKRSPAAHTPLAAKKPKVNIGRGVRNVLKGHREERQSTRSPVGLGARKSHAQGARKEQGPLAQGGGEVEKAKTTKRVLGDVETPQGRSAAAEGVGGRTRGAAAQAAGTSGASLASRPPRTGPGSGSSQEPLPQPAYVPLGRGGRRAGHQNAAPVERLSAAGFRVDTARRGRVTSLPKDPEAGARSLRQQEAREKAALQFPDIEPGSAPKVPPPPPGLYCLVVQSTEIIPMETLADLHAPVEALRALHAQGQLSRKVAAAWGALQFSPEVTETLPLAVLEGVDRCKAAFVNKLSVGIEKEIQAFNLHHDDVLTFSARQKDYEESIVQVERNRVAFIAGEMARYDRGVRIEAEHKEWEWSPLYRDLIYVPAPPILCRPFEHSEDEFQALLKWMEREGRRIGDMNPPPHMARALKLFARSEVGVRMPMLCPVRGLTGETITSRVDQIIFAMEELIRVGKIYFPDMDTVGEEFETFRLVLDCSDHMGEQVQKFTKWRRDAFVRACLDMLALEKEDVLRDMWVRRDGVDCEGVCTAFRNVLLLRENIDLGYCFGSLEATGVWPAAGEPLVEAAKAMQKESLSACHAKLSCWTVTDNLEDLDDFRASQVLCTFDVKRFSGEGISGSGEGAQPSTSGQQEETAGFGQVEDTSFPGQVDDHEPEATSISPVVVIAPV